MLRILTLFLCGILCTCVRAQSQGPNVIVLLADDLGYGDLSCYGSQSIETPHIDALAREGMRFTQFYTASAVCSPSRAALLTGRYPLRYGITGHFSDNQEHLPARATTLAEVLHDNGYRTIHIGKWHLGGLRPRDYEARAAGRAANPGPLQHGFDHALTSIEGAPIRPRLITERQLYRRGGEFMVRNDRRAPATDRHWTEIKVDEAIEQVDLAREAGQPFFLNLWFDVPHTPYEPAPEPHLSKYAAMGIAGDQLYFRSMVSHLDANIGRLIDHLKEIGEYENTLILFTSDNGPAFQGNPGPFRGGKTDLHEGGIRVPFLAVWPGVIPKGTRSFYPFHLTDLFPTIVDALDLPVPAGIDWDGSSQLDRLRSPEYTERADTLLWQMRLYRGYQNQGPKPEPYATAAVQYGGWKLLANEAGPTELFDLHTDFRELNNLIEEQPERATELYGRLQQFLYRPRDTSGFRETAPPAVILDTDIGPDYDDVGTLALFHAFADRGELQPLATVSSNAYERTAPVLSALNTYYGRPDLPIGVTRRNEPHKVDRQGWAQPLMDDYPHPLATNEEAEDAVALYRQLLAAAPDTSVIIVTVGFLTNLADLLDSPADVHSSLPGRELVARKVDRLVSMAARLDEGAKSGREYNVYVDAAAARRVLADWPRPITLSPFELGVQVRTGIPLTERSDLGKHPVQDAYRIALAADNNDRGRMSWDQTTLLAAVRGEYPYFSARMLDLDIEKDGTNRIVEGERLRYLSLAQSPEQVAAVIEALMAHTPTSR